MVENKYCQCKNISKVTSDFNDFCEYDICCTCGKIIEGSERFLNHYDGEDHVNYDEF